MIFKKGYAHLLEGIETAIFPRIASVRFEGDKFTYYYADNGTDEGVFIVAISDFIYSSYPLNDKCSHNLGITFEWQDKKPPNLKANAGLRKR